MFRNYFTRRSWVKEKICQVYDSIDYAKKHPVSTLREIAHQETIEFIQQYCPRAVGHRSSRQLINFALKQVKIDGAFMEFGVYKGGSITYIAKKCPEQTIHGFDSFYGLAEDWVTNPAESFTLHGKLPPVPDNVILYQGYFEQTLPQWLDRHPDKAAFIHVDCDLYSSTVTVLEGLKDRFQPGTVVVFDDYFNFPNWKLDGHKAFGDLVERESLTVTYLGYAYKELAVQLTA